MQGGERQLTGRPAVNTNIRCAHSHRGSVNGQAPHDHRRRLRSACVRASERACEGSSTTYPPLPCTCPGGRRARATGARRDWRGPWPNITTVPKQFRPPPPSPPLPHAHRRVPHAHNTAGRGPISKARGAHTTTIGQRRTAEETVATRDRDVRAGGARRPPARWAAPRGRRARGAAASPRLPSPALRERGRAGRTEEAGRARRRRCGAHLRNRGRGERGRALDADGDEARCEHCGAHGGYDNRRPSKVPRPKVWRFWLVRSEFITLCKAELGIPFSMQG